MRRYGYELPAEVDPDHDRLFDCDRRSCTPHADAPVRLAIWASTKPPKPEVFAHLCASAEVLILRSPMGPGQACLTATVIDGDDFAQGGAVEMWRTGQGWRYRWAEDERGRRPWTAKPGLTDSD